MGRIEGQGALLRGIVYCESCFLMSTRGSTFTNGNMYVHQSARCFLGLGGGMYRLVCFPPACFAVINAC